MDSIKTLKFSGYNQDSILGKSLSVNVYRKRPNLTRFERIIGDDTTYVSFDGKMECIGSSPERSVVTMLNKMKQSGVKTLPSEGFINNFIEAINKVNLIDTGVVNDIECFNLSYQENGIITHFYIDKKTYLLVQETFTYENNGIKYIIQYGEYESINGVMFSKKIMSRSYQNNILTLTTETIYSGISVNINLDEHLFKCR